MSEDGWRKSTFCAGGECLQVRAWRKSRRSVGNGACTEVGQHDHGVAVRDSADPSGPVLALTAASWLAFTAALKAGA